MGMMIPGVSYCKGLSGINLADELYVILICKWYKGDGAKIIHRYPGIVGGQDPKAKDAGEPA